MFDVEKVCRMTEELETFARAYEEIYLIFESMTGETFALFRRLKVNIRAVLSDETNGRETFGLPVLKTYEAVKNFSERTGIIVIVKNPLPIFLTELPFDVNGRRLQIPTFILSPDEVSAIYDRLMILQTLLHRAEDGLPDYLLQDFAMRFACGLKTFLPPSGQSFKFQFLLEHNFNFRYDFSDAAIVIQGPLVYENNYTADTIKLYRKVYPNAPIVVSTWTGEATDDFRKICRENSVALLENVPPDFPGPFNVNMQLESSLQGVKFVRENTDAKFVLKTRCDQRINKPDFLTWFRNLILTFPPLGDKLRGRILLTEGLKWKPFRTTDFLAFGYVEDIAKLYGISRHCGEIDAMNYAWNHLARFLKIASLLGGCKKFNHIPKKNSKLIRKINSVMRRIHEVEIHIMRKFYEENIAAIDYDKFLETGWKLMRDYLVIAGVSDIRLDWPKYEDAWAYNVDGVFPNKIDFARWLDLYRNFNSFGLE